MQYRSPYDAGLPFVHPAWQAALREKRQIRRLTNELGLVTLLGIFLMSILGAGLELLLRSTGYSFQAQWSAFSGIDPVLYYIINGLAYALGLALAVLLYFAEQRIRPEKCLPFSRVRPLTVIACAFLGGAVCLLANIPANIVVDVERFFGFSGEVPNLPLNGDPRVLILYGLNIVIIPPLVEEMLFRGLLLQSLRRFGDAFAIVGSAAFFALYHGNFVQMVFAFPAGLILGLVAVRTNSLLPAMLIHFLNNGISFALDLVQRFQGDEVAATVNGTATAVFIALGILSAAYLLVREKGFFRVGWNASPLRLSAKLGALFWNPGAVALCAYALVSSIYVLVHY